MLHIQYIFLTIKHGVSLPLLQTLTSGTLSKLNIFCIGKLGRNKPNQSKIQSVPPQFHFQFSVTTLKIMNKFPRYFEQTCFDIVDKIPLMFLNIYFFILFFILIN